MDNDDDLQPFSLPPGDAHPADIAARLMRLPELLHLHENEVPFGWLMRNDTKHKGNKIELGSVHEVATMFQGGFKDLGLQLLLGMLGDLPKFLVVLDAQFWEQASARDREALVFHELMHVQQAIDRYGAPKFDRDGLPVFKVVGHDIEAFNAEVVRYGAWRGDIGAFIAAARDA